MYFLQRTRQVFHMVTHFMGYHVGIGKVAVSTQLLLHRSEEREVDIQFLVTRAIEGSHCSRTLSAGCLRAVCIKYHRGVLILSTVLLENLRPHILRASQNLGGELSQSLLFLRKLTLALVHLGICSRQRTQSTVFCHLLHYSLQRVTTRQPCHQRHNDNTTDTHTGLGSTAHTTAIFHIRAFASSV